MFFPPAVSRASENGITTGTDETHFSPDACCTRAEAVTFLRRPAGKTDPGAPQNPFADVPEDARTGAQIVTFLYRADG